MTFGSRTEAPEGRTSPEELLAAAHATVDGGLKVTTMRLQVRGVVPRLDDAGFQKLAEEAKENCPVSGPLKGNVDIELAAHLA